MKYKVLEGDEEACQQDWILYCTLVKLGAWTRWRMERLSENVFVSAELSEDRMEEFNQSTFTG